MTTSPHAQYVTTKQKHTVARCFQQTIQIFAIAAQADERTSCEGPVTWVTASYWTLICVLTNSGGVWMLYGS